MRGLTLSTIKSRVAIMELKYSIVILEWISNWKPISSIYLVPCLYPIYGYLAYYCNINDLSNIPLKMDTMQ